MSSKPQLILVDGSSYLFRAFHALPPLVNSRGQPTGAVKGVINMIRSLMKEYPESLVAVVFDAKGKTFRNEIYTEYKAHRPPMPDDLRSQIQPIHDIVAAMGLPLLVIEGVEADDVIGTLANQATAQAMDTLVSTGDKDLAQLATGHVTLMNTMTGEKLDPEAVEAKFGIPPNRIIDYLALVGDKADNIPGVPGVGPKTAVKWLVEHGSMEGVIENAESIGGKIGERLRENIEQLRLSYELATIKLDVKLPFGPDSLKRNEEDKQKLFDIFSLLEFKTWITELEEQGISEVSEGAIPPVPAAAEEPGDIDVSPNETEYRLVTGHDQLHELLEALAEAQSFAINLECDKRHFMDERILGLAVSTAVGNGYYIPVAHSELVVADQLPLDHVLSALKSFLEDANKSKAGFDLKHLKHLLQNHGVDLEPLKEDVLLMSYVLNSVATRPELDAIVRYHLECEPITIEQVTGKGRNRLALADVPMEQFLPLAAERVDSIHRLAKKLGHQLASEGHLKGLYRYYEMPLIQVLQKMERNGIVVDREVLQKQSAELADKLQTLESRVYEVAGEEFNVGSPKQLQAILYEKLGLPVLKKTKTGQPSTAEPVLQELAESYELPRLIMEQRSLSKLKSTYTDKLPEDVRQETGRIHSSFQQAVAATGRLSSADPNLQNIPIRTAEGRRVRQAFTCPAGYRLLAADYSQVELRIMAHLSQDPGLLNAFGGSQDVHRATAADVFGVALEDVTAEQRRSAKAINFGLIYGMSAFGLANQLNISRGDAQKYVDRYFSKYPGVRKYMDETQALADEKGYVETIFGRRLYLPDIHAGNAMIRKAAQRTAINAPMQGSAADIIKQAMIDIYNWLEQTSLDASMLLQVHDELVFEVSEKDLELLAQGVKFRMTSAASLDVPLVVDVGVGSNWDEAH